MRDCSGIHVVARTPYYRWIGFGRRLRFPPGPLQARLWRWPQVVSMKVDQPVMPIGLREGGIRYYSLLVWLVHIHFVGGWALVGRVISPTINNVITPRVSCQTCWTYVMFVRDRVTPLLGPLPDLRRCNESEKSVRLLAATSMQNNAMNLDQTILATTPR